MKTTKDLRTALATENGKSATLEQLQKAREIYKEIAQEAYKSKEKDYTSTNLALTILKNAFFAFLDSNPDLDFKKTLFMNDKGTGYNAVLAKVENGEYDNVFSIKIRTEFEAEKLIRDYGFYLN